MALIVQLSDLHLLAAPDKQARIFEALLSALEATTARWRTPDLLVMTGDVFDSVALDPVRAVDAFQRLLTGVRKALGGPVPAVIIPGNHDRRKLGLLGPHRDDLFHQLSSSVGDDVFVHGTGTPFLSSVVPQGFHGQRFSLLAYDSTYLPWGYISAGGVIRQEDLLYAASKLEREPSDWPVLFLLHHHLVPTPLTDIGHIEADHSPPFVQWSVRHLLPALIANADREELTMTALGAGTALSTLHSLGRAVLVLHGHKHYATARLLSGMRAGQGDVLLVSAGSCGTAQPWMVGAAGRDVARLWPSFNWVELDEARAFVHTVAFGYKGSSAGRVVFRPLVGAHRTGAKWSSLPVPPDFEEEDGPELEENHAIYRISPSVHHGLARWDYRLTRRVRPADRGVRPRRYVETVDGAQGARVQVAGDRRLRDVPEQIELHLDRPTEIWVPGALARTVHESRRLHGARGAPFSSVTLMNRYRARSARLWLEGLDDGGAEAFASETDLGTGLERPAPVVRTDEGVGVERPDCPARTLLRLYWPLTRDG